MMSKRSLALIGLIAAGVLLVAVGIIMGQPVQVLNKAATICLECVGIG